MRMVFRARIIVFWFYLTVLAFRRPKSPIILPINVQRRSYDLPPPASGLQGVAFSTITCHMCGNKTT